MSQFRIRDTSNGSSHRGCTRFVFAGTMFLLSVVFLSPRAVAADLFTGERADGQDINASFSYVVEQPPFGEITPAQAALLATTPIPGRQLSLGFQEYRVWLLGSISNTSNEKAVRYLQTGQRFLRPIVIYVSNEEGEFEQVLYNDPRTPYEDRPLPLRNLSVPLEFRAGETRQVLINAGGELNLDLILRLPELADQEESFEANAHFLFLGILLALILVNLFHYFAVRRITYLLYAAQQFTLGIYVAHIDGIGYQYFWPDLPILNEYTSSVSGNGINLIAGLFAITFLDLDRHSPKLSAAIKFFAWVSAIGVLLGLLASPILSAQIGIYISAIGGFLLIACGIASYRDGNSSAIYYTASWISIVFVSLLEALPSPVPYVNWFKLGVLAEALLLSFALSDQLRRLNIEARRNHDLLTENLNKRLEETRARLALEQHHANAIERIADMNRKLATTSHDINQPLYGLRLSLNALARTSSDANISQKFDPLLDHLEGLLQSNLAEHSDNAAAPALSLGQLTEQIETTFSMQAESEGITLRCRPTHQDIEGNLVELRRVLFNLVANAITHSGAKNILVGTRKRGALISIYVVDNGVGFSEDSLRRGELNYGLGLSIVQELCDLNQWELHQSSTPGRGTCFRIDGARK